MNYDFSNYTALIAEDDPLSYRYLELILTKRTNINIIWAKNGIEAVALFGEHENIDIVLMDLQLPLKDGQTAMKEIKAISPEMPVIIQTANSWNEEDKACKKAGCDGFFNKPLNIDSLIEHMYKCLKQYSAKEIIKSDY